MSGLQALSALLDRLNPWIARLALRFVLIATVLSVGSALIRRAFGMPVDATLAPPWTPWIGVLVVAAAWPLLPKPWQWSRRLLQLSRLKWRVWLGRRRKRRDFLSSVL
jgi:hypothetical protein